MSGKSVRRMYPPIVEKYPDHVDEVVHKGDLALSAKSSAMIEFRCRKCGRISASTVHARTNAWDRGRNGCAFPTCTGRASIADKYPGHLAEVVNECDLLLSYRSGVKIEFRCTVCGAVESAAVKGRTNAWDAGRTGCGHCRRRGSIAEEYPGHIGEVVNAGDTEISAGSMVQIPFWCPVCLVITTMPVFSKIVAWGHGRGGCGNCRNFVLHGSIAEEYPGHVSEVVSVKDLTRSAKSGARIKFACPACHRVTASTVKDRTNAWDDGNTGCSCVSTGYDRTVAGWLYLIRNDEQRLLQIGVTNNPKKRLRKHSNGGFCTVLDTRKYKFGSDAMADETLLKRSIRNYVGHPLKARISGAVFDGHTESWPVCELSAETLAELFDALGLVTTR
jgi:predicted GIY-YIG superfamily endonuclease